MPEHQHTKQAGPCLGGCVVLCVASACCAGAPLEHKNNVGQSIAHPLARFDLRLRYQDMPGHAEGTLLEARLDKPLPLIKGWTLNTRLNLTGWISDLAGSDNPSAHYVAGMGDLYTQLFLVAPALGQTSVGFGTRSYFPTAGQDQFGFGKYRLAPFVVVQRELTSLPAGSFYGLGLRNEFSFAGDDAREDINRLQIVPILTLAFPQQTFVTLFPEIVIDWQRDNGVFLPFDIEVGRKYAADRAVSLRMQVPLMNEVHNYDWTVEARWSMFF